MAKLTMTQFNVQFRALYDKASIIETTSRAKDAIPIYVQIVDLVINFLKSGECPYPIRQKLILTSETLIQKIKDLKSGKVEPFSSITTSSPPTTSEETNPLLSGLNKSLGKSTKDSAKPPTKNVTEADFASLPEIPTHQPQTDEKPSSVPPPTTVIPPPTSSSFSSPPNISSNNGETTDNLPKKDFSAEILRFEEELRKMPPGVKEVKPSKFDLFNIFHPDKEGKTKQDLATFKDETINLDTTIAMPGSSPQGKDSHFQDLDKKNATNLGFEIKGFTDAPFSKDITNVKSIKSVDPFATPDISEFGGSKVNQRACFACGTPLSPQDQICPSCGANVEGK
jgi:hypothetical protein